MAKGRKIVIGKSSEQAALILQPCHDAMLFKRGIEQPSDGALGKILAALQGLPDLLLVGYVGTTKLMEVQINGELVRASDGMGFRAFAVGDRGITEQAKLFDPSDLAALVDIALVWRLASIVVGQKHLSDISETLRKLERGVSAIAQFQRDEQAAKIESAYEYLRQAEQALMNGERESAVRHRLETIEADMDSIQRHLSKLFDARLNNRIKHENLVGYSDIEEGLPLKLNELHILLSEHRAAGLTRVGALQMLSAFPGEEGLKRARAKAIDDSALRHKSMCDSLQAAMGVEVSQWSGKSESILINASEIAMGQTKFHRVLDGLAKSALRSAGLNIKDTPEINLRGPNGSDTPKLDAMKIAATQMVGKLAESERDGAETLSAACSSMDRLIGAVEAPTRCIVEWGPSGPLRIRQIPT